MHSIRNYIHFICIFCSLSLPVTGQNDTIIDLDVVEIKDVRIRDQMVGGTSKSWNTTTLKLRQSLHLGDLLHQEGGLFIKNYGPGSLATSSIRGGSAGHTLVLWNGLPIQNPMLGLLDLSLIPIISAEQIILEKGGNSALWGSGAIGAVLSLNNKSNFSDHFTLESQTNVANFGHFRQDLNLRFGDSQFQSVTKLSHQSANNDFHYSVNAVLPKRAQTNSNLLQQNLFQDLYWKINTRQKLAIHFWHQFSDRQIPPTITQERSEATQEDRSNRIVLDWQKSNTKSVFTAKIGLFNEHLNFADPEIGLVSKSLFTTVLAELENQWTWRKNKSLYLGATQTHTKAQSPGFENPLFENKSAVFISYRIKKNNWRMQGSLRQELVDHVWVPLVPVVGIEYRISSFLKIKCKVSKNFRLPTLNDRYWMPGGNLNLAAEQGWSEELTVATDLQKSRNMLNLAISIYNRNINNWILWVPSKVQSFWVPQNIAKVWSRGMEPRLSYQYQRHNLNLKLEAGYDHSLSTNQVPLNNPKLEKGSQLIYTPQHQAFLNLALNWKKVHFSYQHQHTGATKGINDRLKSYQLANTRLQYQLSRDKFGSSINFSVNNIYNNNYMVVERRPMPGINFHLGLNILFTKPAKSGIERTNR